MSAIQRRGVLLDGIGAELVRASTGGARKTLSKWLGDILAADTALDTRIDALEAGGAAFADVASAGTVDLGAQSSDKLRITGTTTITSFGTAAAGTRKKLRFAAALTLTYNATSLILPGDASITTAADDYCEAVSLGSGNWFIGNYQRGAGIPVAVTAALAPVVQAATKRLGLQLLNADINVFMPASAPSGTDDTSVFNTMIAAALAAVSGGAPGAIIAVPPGHWKVQGALTAINEDRIAVVHAPSEVCTVEQLTWGIPVWVFEEADNCAVLGGRGLNTQTKSSLSSAIADRRYGEVKRASTAFVVAYNCDYFRAEDIEASGFVEAVSLIGAKRIQNTSSGASDYDSLVLNAAETQANDFYNGWYAVILDDGGGVSSNWSVVSDYVNATNTCVIDPPFTVNGPALTITGITRSSSTATATCPSTSGLSNGSVVYVSGASQSEYNGVFTIANVVSNTSFEYTVSGTPVSPATTANASGKFSVAKVVDPSGTHTYLLRKNVQSVGARIHSVYSEGCDYDILFHDQDDITIRDLESADAEQSQGVTAHSIYGTGDVETDYYKNGSVTIEGVFVSGCHGDAVKIRATNANINGLHAERCRSILALERCDAALVSSVHGYKLGEYHGGADSFAYGLQIADCKNIRVSDWSADISSTYNSGSQAFYGVVVESDTRAVADVTVGPGRFTSNTNASAGGVGVYTGHNATPGPLADLRRITFERPTIVQLGTGAVVGAQFTKGTSVRLIDPQTQGLTGNLYAISSGVTSTYIRADANLLTNTTGTNSGTSSVIKVGARFEAHKNGTDQSGIGNGGPTTLTFGTEAADVGGYFSSNAWNPPPGPVVIRAVVYLTGCTSGAHQQLRLYQGSTHVAYLNIAAAESGGACQLEGTWQGTADGSNAFTIQVFTATGGTVTAAGASNLTYFQGYQMH